MDQVDLLKMNYAGKVHEINVPFLTGMKSARDGVGIFDNPFDEVRAEKHHKSWEDGYIVQHSIMRVS